MLNKKLNIQNERNSEKMEEYVKPKKVFVDYEI